MCCVTEDHEESRNWGLLVGSVVVLLSMLCVAMWMGYKETSSAKTAITAVGQTIVIGCADGSIQLVDSETQLGQTPLRPKGRTPSIVQVAFSSKGSRVYTLDQTGVMRSCDLTHKRWTREQLAYQVVQLAVSSQGTLGLVARDTKGFHVILRTASGVERALETVQEPITALGFSPDGHRVVFGQANGTATIYRVRDAQMHSKLSNAQDRSPITALQFTPDGQYLAVGSHSIVLWDINALALPLELPAVYARSSQRPREVRSLVFAPLEVSSTRYHLATLTSDGLALIELDRSNPERYNFKVSDAGDWHQIVWCMDKIIAVGNSGQSWTIKRVRPIQKVNSI